MTDNQLIERAEAKWPIDDEFSVQELVIQHERQEAYIAAYKEAIEEMSKGWVSAETPPEPGVKVRAIRQYGNGKQEEVHTVWVKRLDCFDDLLTDIITHWQPIILPAPPSINKGEK